MSNLQSHVSSSALLVVCAVLGGCAAPQYAVRQAPIPEESASVLQVERTISSVQAKEFSRQGAQELTFDKQVYGFNVQAIVAHLSRVTERPNLPYRSFLYHEDDPNAAALADGRIYISTGMFNYLAQRGSRTDELAFVLSHELAHTAAQHLIQRYRHLQSQQLIMSLVSLGASAATQSAADPQAAQIALDIAGLLQDLHNSGYSQQQELEADQLGIRYVIRAGFKAQAALDLLQDFSRFETPWPFLRTHPYVSRRREDLLRYLAQTGQLQTISPGVSLPREVAEERIWRLRQAQKLYAIGSISWNNLQQQIEELESR